MRPRDGLTAPTIRASFDTTIPPTPDPVRQSSTFPRLPGGARRVGFAAVLVLAMAALGACPQPGTPEYDQAKKNAAEARADHCSLADVGGVPCVVCLTAGGGAVAVSCDWTSDRGTR